MNSKTIALLVLMSMALGSGLTIYVQTASQPYVYAKEEVAYEPREVRVKIDYTGVSKERIQAMIRESLPEVFIEIARCESETRQYNKRGDVLVGLVDEDDTGLFQVNTRYHETTAVKLGYDITELPGNIAFAKHLYETEGLAPWSASEHCWSK